MTETPAVDSEQAFLDRSVVIALGSNLPGGYSSSRELLDAALKTFDEHGLKVARASSWWRSRAWPEGSGPDFLNGVVIVETDLTPRAVLDALLEIEVDFDRCRDEVNAPRTLDLDLVAYGRETSNAADLILPHPRAKQRRFVMGPLAEIAPTWPHPQLDATAAELAIRSSIGADASP